MAPRRLIENGIDALPSQPKLSISMLMVNWPKMTATVATAAPIRWTASTIMTIYGTPNIAPSSCHLGTSINVRECLGSKKKISSPVTSAPTENVRNALLNTPTLLPSWPLIAAWILSMAPPATARRIMIIVIKLIYPCATITSAAMMKISAIIRLLSIFLCDVPSRPK